MSYLAEKKTGDDKKQPSKEQIVCPFTAWTGVSSGICFMRISYAI